MVCLPLRWTLGNGFPYCSLILCYCLSCCYMVLQPWRGKSCWGKYGISNLVRILTLHIFILLAKVSKEDLPTISVPWPWDLSFLPLPGSLESFSGSSLNPSKEKINLKTKLSRNVSLAFHAALPVGKDSSNSLVNKLTLELPLPEKPSSLPVNPPSSPSCPTKSVTCWLRVLEDCSSLSVLLVSLSLLLLLVIKSSLESKSSEKLSLEPLPQPS